MKVSSRILAVACTAAALPLFAATASAAPLAQSLALSTADTGVVQEVQYRRGWRGAYRGAYRGGWRNGRWIGPAAGFAAGVAVGSVLAPRYYYDEGAYAYAPGPTYVPVNPGYAYAPRGTWYGDRYPPYTGWSSRCTPDPAFNSGYPSYYC